MGRVVVDAGQRLEDVLGRENVEDYSPVFAGNPVGDEGPFSEIVNQDKAIAELVESLSLGMYATLNLGSPGVGKSSATNALVKTLERLDRGEEVTGRYSCEIKEFFDELKSRPRGDIIGLWNPREYSKPIIFRSKTRKEDETLTDIVVEEVDRWLETIKREGLALAYRQSTFLRTADELSAAYLQSDMSGRGWSASWEGEGVGRRLRIKSDDTESAVRLETSMNETILSLGKRYLFHNVVAATDDLLARGCAIFGEIDGEFVGMMQGEFEVQIANLLTEHIGRLDEYRKKWAETEPILSGWYGDVQDFLQRKRNMDLLVQGFLHQTGNMAISNKKEQPNLIQLADFSFAEGDFIQADVGNSQTFQLQMLVQPALLYQENDFDTLVIRQPSAFNPMELFGRIDGDQFENPHQVPIQHHIHLGILSNADVLVLDDALADVVKDDFIRTPLMTYLQDGAIRLVHNGAEVKIEGGCRIFANETTDPFYRQIYEGTEPKYDEGLARRFDIVTWDGTAEHSERTVRNFPQIIENARRKSIAKRGRAVTITPDAMNLLYHNLLLDSGDRDLFPLTIGQYNVNLFERLLARSKNGTVDAESVREFFWAERNHVAERTLARDLVAQNPFPADMRAVGRANYLFAINAGIGGAGQVIAAVTNKRGRVHSLDVESRMTDETFRKGVLTTESWINGNFGPLDLEMVFRVDQNSPIGGPSCGTANTYAVLSALGNIPILQHTYSTGEILDLEGTVGPIGHVYEKTRGAWNYHWRRYGKSADAMATILIPEGNSRELVRSLQFDSELQEAIAEGQLQIRTHDTVWDGFAFLSGLDAEIYRPSIAAELRRREREVALHEYTSRRPFMGAAIKRMLG